MTFDTENYSQEQNIMSRAYEREKERRRQAEKVLDTRSRELYLANEELLKSNRALTDAVQMLENQSHVISGLSNKYVEVTSDLKLAAAVQYSLLPSPIDVPEIQAAGIFRPAQFVGGDGYDYFFLAENIFAFYVIDVAGHGIASALTSFAVQSHLNVRKSMQKMTDCEYTMSLEALVLDTLKNLNETFAQDETFSSYFTMVYGLIDLRNDRVFFSQAGHPPPLHLNSNTGEIVALGSGGFPIGMFPEADFTVNQFQLVEGDRLVIYSDGSTECESIEEEEFGIERLTDSIRQSEDQGVIESAQYLEDCLVKWQGHHAFEDDISIVVIDYKRSLKR